MAQCEGGGIQAVDVHLKESYYIGEAGRTSACSCQVYFRLHRRTTETTRVVLEIYTLGNDTINTTL